MSDLNPDARRLIKIARGGDLPSQADKERLRAALAARIASPDAAAPAPAPGPAPPAPPPASPTPLSTALPLKGALVGGLLGGAALITFLAARPAPAPLAVSSASIVVTAPAGAVSAPVAEVTEVLEPAAPVAAVTAAPVASASGAAPARTSEPTGPDGRAGAPRLSAPAVDALQQELALLAQAKEALGRGDLSAAREALSQHQQRYPRSSFAQEREVLSFLIACRAGQASGVKPQVRAFLARNPRSPYAVPLRTACGEPEE